MQIIFLVQSSERRACPVLQGHRTLVFSQSRVMLDILQIAIKAADWSFLRLDGSITSAADRAVCHCCCCCCCCCCFLWSAPVASLDRLSGCDMLMGI
jgi:hypothetical protein